MNQPKQSTETKEALFKRGLVTGATAPLGRLLIDELLQDPRIDVILAVGAEAKEALYGLPSDPRFQYEQVDLTRFRRLRRLLFGAAKTLEIDAIIHTAQHRRASDTKTKAHILNVESTRALLHLSERHPTIRRFVYRSYGEMYKISADLPGLIEEDHPLSLSEHTPQWLRDRIEADLTVCSHMGLAELEIVVLRCAECLSLGTGSQLCDYLGSRVCFRPMGFDPMLNVLSLEDLSKSLLLALQHHAQGIFNIPGKDTLPLSLAIKKAGRAEIAVPEAFLPTLYWARRLTRGYDFRYDMNRWRFHFNGVLDGRRAREVFGYVPDTPVDWFTVGVC